MLKRKLVEVENNEIQTQKIARKKSSVLSIVSCKKSQSRPKCIFDDQPPTEARSTGLNNEVVGKHVQEVATQVQVPKYQEILTCPGCHQLLLPPIKLCLSGHSFCSECKKKVQTCPLCKDMISQVRNFSLESFVKELDLPCKYASFGCETILQYCDRRRHQTRECEFKPFECFNCHIDIPQNDFEDHFKGCWPVNVLSIFDTPSMHSNTNAICSDNFVFDVKRGPTSLVSMIKVPNFGIFLRRLLKEDSTWHLWYSVAKCEKLADQFGCCVNVIDDSKRVRIASLRPVSSLHVHERDIVRKGLCFTFSDTTFLKMNSSDGQLLFQTEIRYFEIAT